MEERSSAPLARGGAHPPLYLQLSRELQNQIANGELAPGEQLPSESRLCGHYNVSRHVVRQALSRLVAEGQVEARHGSGYFVNRPRVRHRLPALTSFSTEAARAGGTVGYAVLRQALVSASPRVAKILCEPGDDRVVYVERIASLNGEAVALLRTWFPIRYSDTLLSTSLDDRSITALLQESHGEHPEVAESVLSVEYATSEQARSLSVREGSALLTLETTARGEDGRAVEFSISAYRGDRFEFTLGERRAPDGATSSAATDPGEGA